MKIVRMKNIPDRIGLSIAAIYDKQAPSSPRYDATFPKRIKLGASAAGVSEEELDRWLLGQKAAAEK